MHSWLIWRPLMVKPGVDQCPGHRCVIGTGYRPTASVWGEFTMQWN
jgi:hypothetical protein